MNRLTRSALAASVPVALLGSIAAVPMTATASTGSTAFLSDLTPVATSNGWGPVERDRSNGERSAGDGRVLTIGGQTFAKGLGVHASSSNTYTVPAGCNRLSAVVGVDDEVGVEGSVVFQVFDGATKLYDSGLLRGTGAGKSMTVPVVAGRAVRLVVTDGGNGNGKDHADWANAHFTCDTTTPAPSPSSSPAPVASEPFVSDLTPVGTPVNAWGPVEKDRSNGERTAGDGKPITLQGQTFAKGLGVHAGSEVQYVVPAGHSRFEATVGVDDEVGVEGSVVFQVFVGTTKLYDSGLLAGFSASEKVSVPVTAGSTVRLVVTDGGNGNGKDHGDWADARFTAATTTSPTTEPTATPTSPAAPTTVTGTVAAPASPTGAAGAWTATLTEEFDGTALNAGLWNDREPWQGTSGYSSGDSGWVKVPTPASNLSVADGRLSLKMRREAGLPSPRTHSTAHINTRSKFAIPAGVTSYTEARLKAPSNLGSLPAFWLLGNGTSGDGGGWPITGEIDILEFANNLNEATSPYFSVWYPKDVWTNAPGTFLNGTHDTHPASWAKRPDLKTGWHTWGLYRSPEKMELRIDGQLIATFVPNTAYKSGIPLPPMLFTNSQHIRLSYGMGGSWAGAGLTTDQYQDGDFDIDYVKVWQQ